MHAVVFSAALLYTALTASAKPAPGLRARQSITALSTAQIDTFTPYTWYASAGYCAPAATLA